MSLIEAGKWASGRLPKRTGKASSEIRRPRADAWCIWRSPGGLGKLTGIEPNPHDEVPPTRHETRRIAGGGNAVKNTFKGVGTRVAVVNRRARTFSLRTLKTRQAVCYSARIAAATVLCGSLAGGWHHGLGWQDSRRSLVCRHDRRRLDGQRVLRS